MDELSYQYERIFRDLADGIASGEWKPGDRLPTEMELAQQYSVSRITSKKALNLLAQQGMVTRRRGMGTYVAQKDGASSVSRPVAPRNSIPRIGLIMEDLGESYALGLYYEIDRRATKMGYQVCLGVSYGDQRREREVLNRLLSLDIDGLIVMPAHGTYYDTALLRLVLDHFPVVLIDRPLNGIPAPVVCSDNYAGSRLLTEHLAHKGHHNIVYITTSISEATSLVDRYRGYERAMQELGLEVHRPLVMPELFRFGPVDESTPHAQSQGQDFLCQWLKDNPHVTAIIGSEYGVAHLARACARSMGRKVPEDLAICCFDEKYGYLGEFDFTHIQQDEAAIARDALDILQQMLQGQNMRRQARQIGVTLREGTST